LDKRGASSTEKCCSLSCYIQADALQKQLPDRSFLTGAVHQLTQEAVGCQCSQPQRRQSLLRQLLAQENMLHLVSEAFVLLQLLCDTRSYSSWVTSTHPGSLGGLCQ